MKSRRGVVGAVAGATAATVAAGVATGVAVERYTIGRLRGRADQEALRDFHASRGSSMTVTGDDGIDLHVEIDGDDAPAGQPTVVFCHGYALEHACWYYQRDGLAGLGRRVFWDQRCHGRSGRASQDGCTIESLGRDLRAVLNAVVPEGPVVLVGHSMGGMTIMAFADEFPEMFRDRVVGVGLINTSAAGLGEFLAGPSGLALRTLAPPVLGTLSRLATPVERLRPMGRLASHVSTQRLAFGDEDIRPELVAFIDGMISATPVDVVADFYPAVMSHDRSAVLSAFRDVPTSVVIATADRIIPADAGRAIAEHLPHAEVTEVLGAGHLVMLERPEIVNDAVRALVSRATSAAEYSP